MSISTNDTLLQSDDKRAWRSWALYDCNKVSLVDIDI